MLTDFYVNKYYTNKLYKFRRGNQKLGRGRYQSSYSW